MPTLSSLLVQKTQQEMLADLLTYLQARGYSLTDFYSGSVQRTLIETDAQGLADLTSYSANIAQGGFVELAAADWLTLLSESQYNIVRQPATATEGLIRVTAEIGFGPVNVAVGQMLFSTASGLTYFNTEAFTVPDDGHIDTPVKASQTGSAYNVSSGTITIISTPIVGISCNNQNNWITKAGSDQESDIALRNRCKLRWAELGYGATKDAYIYWALTARPEVKKVKVLDNLPRGQGTVDVIIYGDGALGNDVVNAVDAYIQLRKPITADVYVYSASQHNISVNATVYYKAGSLTLTQSAITTEMANLQSELGIGDTVYRSRILEALFVRPYVTNVVLTAPAADHSLTTSQAAHFNLNITYTQAS